MKAMAITMMLLLCAGCAKHSDKGGSRTPFCKVVELTECRTPPVPANPVTTFKRNQNEAEPHVLCVKRPEGEGINVDINITPASGVTPNTVFVINKDSSDEWLFGSNSDLEHPNRIRIHVPAANVVPNGGYDFVIFDVEKRTCLDPRWEVN